MMSRTKAKLGTGRSCMCPTCGEYFTALSSFDRHRVGEHGSKVCVAPESVGLEVKTRGSNTYWGMPDTTGGDWRLVTPLKQ